MKFAKEEVIMAKQDDLVKYNDTVIYPDKVRINLEYYKRSNFYFDMKVILFSILGKNLEVDWMN